MIPEGLRPQSLRRLQNPMLLSSEALDASFGYDESGSSGQVTFASRLEACFHGVSRAHE